MSFFSSEISLLHLFVHHGDDPSWIQYQALWLLRMKFQEQTYYCSCLLQIHHISSRTCSTIWDWVWLLTQSIQEKQWWGLGARRLAPHTHTLVSQTELLNKSQKCGLRQKLLYNIHDRIPLSVLISSEVLSCRYVTRYFRKIPTYSSEKSHQPTFWMEKGLEGPSHFSLAWNSRSCWKSLLKTPMSLNVTGVDFPVEKIWCDWRNQQRSKA